MTKPHSPHASGSLGSTLPPTRICTTSLPRSATRWINEYLDFRKDGVDSSGVEEVMLFSGGLDSFGGAVKEIADGRRKVALVSHEPTSKVGACSQCIDRRLVATAAGMTDMEDPPEMYKEDLFEHTWLKAADATLIEGYLRTTKDILSLDDPQAFMTRFGSMAQALRHAGKDPREVARSAFELHKRHARQINEALEGALRDRVSRLLSHNVPPNSLLGIAIGLHGLNALQAPSPTKSDAQAKVAEDFVSKPTVDETSFTFRYGLGKCFLGNTVEFRLLERLSRRPEQFIEHGTLMEDVWGRRIEKNTIAKTVGNLRRRLSEAEVVGVTIDGSQKGHYRLHLT